MAGIYCGSSVGREAEEPSVPLATGAQTSAWLGRQGGGSLGWLQSSPQVYGESLLQIIYL